MSVCVQRPSDDDDDDDDNDRVNKICVFLRIRRRVVSQQTESWDHVSVGRERETAVGVDRSNSRTVFGQCVVKKTGSQHTGDIILFDWNN